MTRYGIFIGLFLLLARPVFSQNEIKIYGGYLEYPGFSFERNLKKNLSLEIGGSFLSLNKGPWHGLDLKDNNLFIHGMLKKYPTNKKGKMNFFYGAYLRYWRTHNYAVDAEQEPLPASLQSLLDAGETVTYATITQKVSLGFLIGFKWRIVNRLTMGINLGLGFSIPATYWQKEYTYNQPVTTQPYGTDPWIGYANHLSFIGQFGLGYQFGKDSR